MLFLRSWLEEYISLDGISNEILMNKITLGSSEVEEVRMLKDYFDAKVLIGRIENVRNHENADRLKVFDVNLGSRGSVQIVSAAPNVAEGIVVPVAIEGAVLPFLTIARRMMRGVESQGMCLGKSELMLETRPSSGLLELQTQLRSKAANNNCTTDVFFGQSICEVFPELFPEDTVYDIKVLPNRVSEIGHHLGMAGEIESIFGSEVQVTNAYNEAFEPARFNEALESAVHAIGKSDKVLNIHDTTDYAQAFSLFDITIQDHYYLPHHYQKRMFLTGRNLTGTIADLTNYFLGDFGHPTHVFSAKKSVSKNNEINWVVDRTTTPIRFKGLGKLKDGLVPSGIPILYPSDAKDNILSLPGISGALSSKADYDETQFLFEIANFEADDVAQSSFDLKYRSDGSKLWAGGVNKALMGYAMIRLVREASNQGWPALSLCGLYDATSQSTVYDAHDVLSITKGYYEASTEVEINIEYLARRLDGKGSDEWTTKLHELLGRMGSLKDNRLTPNPLFSNIRTQNDVWEELVRLIDYDDLNSHEIPGASISEKDLTYESLLNIKKLVSEYGFQEIITRPFVAQQHLNNFDPQRVIQVIKPYNNLMPFVRDNLTSSLLLSIADNLLRGEKTPMVFELGLVYLRYEDQIQAPRHITLAGINSDPYIFTSIADAIVTFVHTCESADWKRTESEQGSVMELIDNGSKLAEIREISNQQKKLYNLPLSKKVFVVDVILDQEFSSMHYDTYSDESQYPSIRRTYSLQLDTSITYASIREIIQSQAESRDFEVRVKPVERISTQNTQDILNFELIYTSYSRTLEGEEIADFEQSMISAASQLGSLQIR